jgi:hypothetical protein
MEPTDVGLLLIFRSIELQFDHSKEDEMEPRSQSGLLRGS